MNSPAHYPLTWPGHIERARTRESGRFKTSIAGAIRNVEDSIRRFGSDSGRDVKGVVISSNYSLGDRKPRDPGVAVWFVWDGTQVCIPVDRYTTIEANLQAIHHVVEARRVELRHGTLALVKASFAGFAALPPPPGSQPKRSWWTVMDFSADSKPTRGDIDSRYKALAKQRHSDMPGGSDVAMAELNGAYAEAKREVAA